MRTPVYDLLVSADVLSADAEANAKGWVDTLGLPPPRPSWADDYADGGYRAIFARVHKWMGQAPTRLELISPLADAAPDSMARVLLASQKHRPVRTHATVVGSSRVPELVERLRSRGLRHWFDPAHGNTPDRVWMGFAQGDWHYSPEVDAGLHIEIIDTGFLNLPARIFEAAPPLPAEIAAAQMTRIVARAWLVEDLDAVLRSLDKNLDWLPSHAVQEDVRDGVRRATLPLAIGHSAALELIQPADAHGFAGQCLGEWGPGPFTIRIAVLDLPAKAEDLRSRRQTFEWLPATEVFPERLRVPPTPATEALVEFVEREG